LNVLEAFHLRVAMHPSRIAVVDGSDVSTSYGDLDLRARSLAASWRGQGLVRGDRVLLALKVDADLYAALAALWMLGAVAVFSEPALGIGGLRNAVVATAPRAFLANGHYRVLPWLVPSVRRIALSLRMESGDRAMRDFEDMDPADHALISFTSGSTGRPKAIARSHGFLVSQDAAVAPLLASSEHHVDLVCFPVFVVSALGRGDTSVLPDWKSGRPDAMKPARVRTRCEAARVDRLLVSPAVAHIMGTHGLPSRTRTVFVGGGPVFPDLVRMLGSDQSAPEVVGVYGSTEAEPIAHCHVRSRDTASLRELSSGPGLLAGHVVDAAKVRIVDDEIQVSGDHVVGGYLDPARDAGIKVRDADGRLWHRTGDAGVFDDRGRLWLLGRHEGRVGGLWPFPVESAARAWSGVSKAALVAVAGQPVLAIEGDASHARSWTRSFQELGGSWVAPVGRIPVDRRHGSKVDLIALSRMLSD
jgi:acyl-CoA synthetase (AMP-forming)/AMP-acid ligase II